MRVCLLTTEGRHTADGERIAPLAAELGASIVVTGTAEWEGATHIDELGESFDAVIAFGWRACLHVFRIHADKYAHVVPGLEDAAIWHGDEKRMLAAITYDLPLTLIAPSEAVATALRDQAPARRTAVVRPGVRRDAFAATAPLPDPGSTALRVATDSPAAATETLGRASEPSEQVALGNADVLLALGGIPASLTYVAWAQLAGIVPIVTPVPG